MKYSVILFDLDQTLFDTDLNAEKSLKKLELPFSFTFTDDRILHWHHLQQKMWGDLEKGKLSRQQLNDTRFQAYFDYFDQKVDSVGLEQQYEEIFYTQHELMPHAKMLLETLQADYQLEVISNGTILKQKQMLHNSATEHYFDKMFLAENIGYSKPNAKFFDAVVDELKPYQRKDMLVIGDSLSADIQGANNASIDSVWFNRYQVANEKVSPTYEVSDLKDIIKILE
ncbi:YjjG family noncanonical pyrimidine nucleotidase [Companilactobacillus sp. FL22-1]|uniref:YjjG family noncanonical pyrimidine nucleotidase n=1 Tax=Companilactobacillus sp. FL22-1 TaxID=3373892 RepID=UPI003754EA6D